MKSLLVCFVFSLFVLHANAAMDPEIKKEIMDMMAIIGRECVSQEGATQGDVDLILTHHMPSSREGVCVIACFNEKVGMQSADGKMSMEGSMRAIDIFQSQVPEIYDKFVLILQKCIPPTQGMTDRCDIAGNFAECAKSYAAELGLDETML